MPNVFRQQYTRPIPEGAKECKTTIRRRGKLVEVPAVRFKGEDGRAVTAPVVQSGEQAGTHCRIASPTWYGTVRGVKVPLYKNKAASEVELGKRIKEAEQEKAGILPNPDAPPDPFEGHLRRPLAEHVEDFRRELQGRGRDPRYVELVCSRLQALFAGCDFSTPGDLSAD